MLEFEPTGMALVAQWLSNNWLPFAAGMAVGAAAMFVMVAVKLSRLRRDGVL